MSTDSIERNVAARKAALEIIELVESTAAELPEDKRPIFYLALHVAFAARAGKLIEQEVKPVEALPSTQEDWEDAIDQCDEILELLGELPDRAADFGESVAETVGGIRASVQQWEAVTENQQQALDNIMGGVTAWL